DARNPTDKRVERPNKPLIDHRVNNELDRSLCNRLDLVPSLLDVVLRGLELIAQSRDDLTEAVKHRLDIGVVHRDQRILRRRPRLTQTTGAITEEITQNTESFFERLSDPADNRPVSINQRCSQIRPSFS